MQAANSPFNRTAHADDAADNPFELTPGERIGQPLPSAFARLLRRTALLLVIAGAGWAWFEHRERADAWTAWAAAQATGALTRVNPQPPPHRASLPYPEPTTLERTAPRDAPAVAGQPLDDQRPAASMQTEVAHVARTPAEVAMDERADQGEPSTTAPLEPLPPPVIDPNDALQAKALASGLNPSLSRALLAVLSGEDFRNARIAIRTALAMTPDGETYVHPAKPQPGLARFEIKFVTGTRGDCRRYVVRIGKDGWATTALPMETCGITKPRTANIEATAKAQATAPKAQAFER